MIHFENMNKILPSEKAEEICLNWMKELDSSLFGSYLQQQGNGKMLGVLICSDGTVLRAYSGNIDSKYNSSGFVPKCYDQDKMNKLLESADKDLEQTTDKVLKSRISANYWEEIKKIYVFHCFDGQVRKLSDICPNAQSGTGDCCAPRLLNFCYETGRKPEQLAEFFYGNGTYTHKTFYAPCEERCRPILKFILGLDIVYQDNDIVVVNKQSGLLSIEGRTEDKQDCIASRVRSLYNTIQQPCVHRLDMATSGLMVLAKTQKAHDILNSDFENRKVFKLYKALVEGRVPEDMGEIELPIRLDVDNRPIQIVDKENGKPAKTTWYRTRIVKHMGKVATELVLRPHTGRTHQLRVHCSSGLGHSIIGDNLYGHGQEGDTLFLHAWVLKFHHPITGKVLSFTEPCKNW